MSDAPLVPTMTYSQRAADPRYLQAVILFETIKPMIKDLDNSVSINLEYALCIEVFEPEETGYKLGFIERMTDMYLPKARRANVLKKMKAIRDAVRAAHEKQIS